MIESDDSAVVVAVDDGDGGPTGTGERDGLAVEIDVFDVGSRRHQNGVTITRRVDSRLDGRKLSGIWIVDWEFAVSTESNVAAVAKKRAIRNKRAWAVAGT
jgi:hypothetical protein